jgi:hypothetical protein
MIGRRCKMGCSTWPDKSTYSLCPSCGEATFRFSGITPLTDEQASFVVKQLEFEDFYENEWPALREARDSAKIL